MNNGVSSFGVIGCAVAAAISVSSWHSIGWAILHAFLSWVYVVYYLIFYGSDIFTRF
jgi:hypothetical protein